MSKKISLVGALGGVCALSLFLLNCGSSSSRPSGLLYVLTQGTSGTGNNISSFAIDLGSGGLSLINSTAPTCKTPGVCGLPLDIVLDPTGATAFVLSQNAISSYTVNSDGSFGSPSDPLMLGGTAIAMTRDTSGNFLFVITAAPELLVYKMTPGSTSLTLANSVVLTRVPTGLSALTFPAPGSGTVPPCGFTTSEEFLYVTSNQDLTPQHNDNALSVYCVDSSGNLTDKTPDPPYTPQVDPLSVKAVNTTPSTQTSAAVVFVYVGSQPSASGALSAFQMCTAITATCTQSDVTNAVLRPVGTSPPSTGQDPVAMVVDPTNQFLYVVCYGSNQVFAYLINSTQGTLTALSPANEPTGSQPVALALHPSVGSTGQFLYTSNSNSSNITGFTLNTTSGAMSSPITVSAPAAPSGMTAR
jgi:6-phosphogluconolactonase (cycloisomerase 2 family)